MEKLYHVKPERRWLYIQRRLKKDEIDYSKIAIDLSIPLQIDFFTSYWHKLPFEILITALAERYNIEAIRKFLLFAVPRAMIIKHADYFADKELIECIKGVKLGDSFIELRDLYKTLGATAPRAFAWFMNEGNINRNAGLKFIIDHYGAAGFALDEAYFEFMTFLNEIEDPDIFKDILDKYTNRFSEKRLAEIEALFYKKFPYIIQHGKYKIKYNKKLKGELWLKSKWHGLKNIVQKQSKNLFSLTSRLKTLLRSGTKMAK